MVNPNRLSDLIDRSNSNIDVIKDNFLVWKGLDEKDFKDEDSMRLFESVFPVEDSIRSLMKDRKDLFKVLEKMLQIWTLH